MLTAEVPRPLSCGCGVLDLFHAQTRRRRLRPAPHLRPRQGRRQGSRAWRLFRRSEPRATCGGGGGGRPGAGAGRRRHRQDAGADHAAGAHPRHRPRQAMGAAGCHLHQQGGARDARADHPPGRVGRRRPSLARHLPLGRRTDSPPPRRAGRAEVELHHPGCRRPGAAAETADRGGEHRRQALDAAPPVRPNRPVEEQGPDARQAAGGRGRGLRQWTGGGALRAVPGSTAHAERLRLRRPSAAQSDDLLTTC